MYTKYSITKQINWPLNVNTIFVYSSQIVWAARQLAMNIPNQHLENSFLYNEQIKHKFTYRKCDQKFGTSIFIFIVFWNSLIKTSSGVLYISV